MAALTTRARRTGLGLLAAAGFGTLLTACGETRLDMAKLEKTLKTEIEKQTSVTVDTVDCPESKEVKVEEGGVFECDVSTDQGALKVKVTQNDDKGNVSWEVEQ